MGYLISMGYVEWAGDTRVCQWLPGAMGKGTQNLCSGVSLGVIKISWNWGGSVCGTVNVLLNGRREDERGEREGVP